jgi:hypothetical protein
LCASPPKFILKFDTHYTVLRGRPSGKWINHESFTFMNGLVFHKRDC